MVGALFLLVEALVTMAVSIVWTIRKLLGLEEPDHIPKVPRAEPRPPSVEPPAT